MHLSKTSNALPITHCIAQRAFDYHKRSSVLRITTSDWKVFLLQAPYVFIICNYACKNQPCEYKLHLVVFLLISSLLSVVFRFCKLQKKAH